MNPLPIYFAILRYYKKPRSRKRVSLRHTQQGVWIGAVETKSLSITRLKLVDLVIDGAESKVSFLPLYFKELKKRRSEKRYMSCLTSSRAHQPEDSWHWGLQNRVKKEIHHILMQNWQVIIRKIAKKSLTNLL